MSWARTLVSKLCGVTVHPVGKANQADLFVSGKHRFT